MGQILIRGAAAAVGFAIGGPTGAQIGWGLGGLFASAPDKVTRVQGPTLDDLRVYGTEYGQCIPWARGTICTAGQVWWNSDKIPTETTHTTTQSGGKGDTPSQSTVETITTYHMDLLIGLLDHEIVGIRRIWDAGKLIYSAADGADTSSINDSQNVEHWDRLTVYTGTSTQNPDPDYEAAVGTGFAPAYRHRAYVFIKGLKLGQSPAQLRNLTFEVVVDGTVATTDDWVLRAQILPAQAGTASESAVLGDMIVMPNSARSFFSTDGGINWSEGANRLGGGTSNNAGIAAGLAWFVTTEDGNGNPGNPQGVKRTQDASTWAISTSGFSNSGYASSLWRVAYDPNEQQLFAVNNYNQAQLLGLVAGRRSLDDGDTWLPVNNLPANIGWTDIAFGNDTWVIITENIVNASSVSIDQIRTSDDPGLLTFTSVAAPSAKAWKKVCYAGNDIFIAVASTGEFMRSTNKGASWSLVAGAPSKSWSDIAAASGDEEGTVVAVANNGASTTNAYVSFDYGATWQSTTLPHEIALRTICYSESNGRFIASGNNSTGGNTGLQNFLTLEFARDIITRTPISVEEMARTIMNKAGLTEGYNYDVDDLSTITRLVYSMPVSQVGPARSSLDVLSTAYPMVCRAAGMVSLTPRAGSSIKTIPYADLGAGLGRGNYNLQLPLDLANDIEVMANYAVLFRNYSFDFQRGVELSDRQITAVPGTIEEITIPMGFPPSEAKFIADAIALDKATSTFKTTLYLLSDHVEIEPGDVFTVTDENGNQYRMRCLEKEDTFPLIKLEAAVENAIIITSEGVTDENYDEQINISGITGTEALYIDGPMLDDSNNDIGFYVVGRGDDTEKAWPGFSLHVSDNDVDYSVVTALSNASKLGFCTTTLGAPLSPNAVLDTNNILRVNLGSGVELVSSTYAAVIASQLVNACAVQTASGWELMQFITATFVSDGVYDLSGLLRGRKGTEWAMGLHTSGERFAMLEPNRVTRAVLNNSQLGVSRFYKAVTFDRDIDTVESDEFTTFGVSRKPWAPVYLYGSRDGSFNATIDWDHRSRFSTRMYGDLGVNVPLGENEERYEIEIYSDNTYTTIVHSDTVTGASSYEFSAADQTGAGLTPGDLLYVRVYQISDVVGRGYVLQGTA